MNTWQPTSPGQWTRTLSFPLTTRLHVPGEDGRLWDASVPVGTTWTPAMARANFLIVEEAGKFTLLTPYEDRSAFFGWTLGRAAKQLNVTWSHYGQNEAVRRAHAWHQSVGCTPSVRVNFREHGLDPVAQAILTGRPWPV